MKNIECDEHGICTSKITVSTSKVYAVGDERAKAIRPGQELPAELRAARGDGRYFALGAVVKARGVDEKKRTATWLASTEREDLTGDIIRQRGWDLSGFHANSPILWAHDSYALPIARGISARVEREGLVITTQFPDPGEYDFADVIFRLVVGGFIRAVSVGFFPTKFAFTESGIDFMEQRLLELSLCNVPANPDCLLLSKGFETALRSVEFADSVDRQVLAEKKSWTRSQFRKWLKAHGLSQTLLAAEDDREFHVATQTDGQQLPEAPPGIRYDRPAKDCACHAKAEAEPRDILDLLLEAPPAPPAADSNDVMDLLLRDKGEQQARLKAECRANRALRVVQ